MITVKELKEKLSKYPDDYSVMTKKTEITGNVGYINSIKEDSYGFFGVDIPCVLLTDEFVDEIEMQQAIDNIDKLLGT